MQSNGQRSTPSSSRGSGALATAGSSTLQQTTSIKAKFNPLSEKFDGFEDTLQLQKQKKKSEDEKRIVQLQTQLDNLQNTLQVESRNRTASMQALQNWLSDRFAQFRQDVEIPMLQKLDAMGQHVDSLTSRVEAVERAHAKDRETFPSLIDNRITELLREISDLKASLDVAQKQREEKDKRIMQRVQDLNAKTLNLMGADKTATEKKLQVLRQDLVDEANLRLKSMDTVRSSLQDDIDRLKEGLQKEQQERQKAEEDMVQAINHYAGALQDAIKIVSTQ